MALIWQTMAHTWSIYGQDMGWLEHHMRNIFVKFQAMGSTWD